MGLVQCTETTNLCTILTGHYHRSM